jgi:hypothetical protein
MDDLAVTSKEDAEAIEKVRLHWAHVTKLIHDYQQDPEAAVEAADVAPHLVNRR